ncbi:DUF6783 domain-containing protein [Hungatella hominis]
MKVAPYASPIRGKSPTNCDAHLAESNFQTHSSITDSILFKIIILLHMGV